MQEESKRNFPNDIKLIYIEKHEKNVYDSVTFPFQNFHLILLQANKIREKLKLEKKKFMDTIVMSWKFKVFYGFFCGRK